MVLAVSTHLAVSSAYSCSREARQRVEERREMRVIFMVCVSVSRWRVYLSCVQQWLAVLATTNY